MGDLKREVIAVRMEDPGADETAFMQLLEFLVVLHSKYTVALFLGQRKYRLPYRCPPID